MPQAPICAWNTGPLCENADVGRDGMEGSSVTLPPEVATLLDALLAGVCAALDEHRTL